MTHSSGQGTCAKDENEMSQHCECCHLCWGASQGDRGVGVEQLLPPAQLMHIVDPHPPEPGSQAQRHIPVQAGSLSFCTFSLNLSSELMHGSANLCHLAAGWPSYDNVPEEILVCICVVQKCKQQAETIGCDADFATGTLCHEWARYPSAKDTLQPCNSIRR